MAPAVPRPPSGVAPALALLVCLALCSCARPLHLPHGWAERLPALPEAADYYLEIAFGSEYGEPADHLRTWGGELRLRVFGSPTKEDLAELDRVVAELNALAGAPRIRRVEEGENVEVRFVPQAGFDRYAPDYARKNAGYVYIWWTWWYSIFRGRVLIRSEGLSRRQRAHVIREEVTQALGLLNDSWRYPDSIFYQGPSEVTEFSEIDRAVIRLHEANRPLTGATEAQLRQAFARSNRPP